MRVKIKKELFVPKDTKVFYKGIEYGFNSNDELFIDIDGCERTLYVVNPVNSSVRVSVIDIFLEFFSGDSMITEICPDYSFDVLSDDNCEIILKENEQSFNFGYIVFKSFCAVSQTATLGNDRFAVRENIDKLAKKHKRLNLLVMSGLPLYILVALLAVLFSYELFLLYIIIFLIFTIPSIKSKRNFKKAVTKENIINYLSSNVIGYRTDENFEYNKMNKSSKFMFKIFDKLFKLR